MQFVTVLLYILLAITSLFLICLVLIQRGKGGGLAGAFGGSGGSSAFGSKAGDVFTRVTMITAAVWISQAMLLVVISNNRTSAWAKAPRAGASKASEFTPSEKIDLDKLGKPGSSLDLGPNLPPPPPSAPKALTVEPAPVIPGGTPVVPTTLPEPLPKDAPTPATKP